MTLQKLFLRLAAVAGFGVVLCGAASAAGPKVVATVNGVQITDQDLAVAAVDLAPTIPDQVQGPQREQYILTYLIDLNLVANKALSEKLDQGPDFARQMAYYRQKVLMETLLGKTAHDAASESAIQQAYDAVAKAQKPETEVHARQILVSTKDQADGALKRVKGGEDFGKVADQTSKDPKNNNGGDLGWFTKDQMAPPLADIVFSLQPGQISDPVQSQFGWHVIKVEGRREKPFPPLSDVRADVERYVEQKAQGDLITQLRQSAKVERTDQEAAPPSGGNLLISPLAPAPNGK